LPIGILEWKYTLDLNNFIILFLFWFLFREYHQ
jgi:hypothetical protein